MNSSQFATNFWSRVSNFGKPNMCWVWTASCYRNGYGQVSHNYQKLLAHRVAYELARGPIPENLLVLHRCDNRPCCNPAHLWLGTHRDNLVDMHNKGRANLGNRPKGEHHHRAKF